MIGVEAGGLGIATEKHAARFEGGSVGILQGTKTFILQDNSGQVQETHSVSAGLDYAAVGPEHAWLREMGRAKYVSATDDEAIKAFHLLAKTRGNYSSAREFSCSGLRRENSCAEIKGYDDSHQPVGSRR